MLLHVGQDVVLPYPTGLLLVQTILHQVARPDGGLLVGKQLVRPIDDTSGPRHIRVFRLQPPTEQSLDRILVRTEFHEVEPPPQRQVHQGNGAVGRVHRADDVQIRRHVERLTRLRILKTHLLVPVLQQEVQLSEHLCEVPPVDLVDHEEMLLVRLLPRHIGHFQQRPVLQLESRLPPNQPRTEPLHEVLIRIRRVKLHQPHPLLRPSQTSGQLLGRVCLPSPRRPLEDDLQLVLEQLLDPLKELHGEHELVG